MGFPSVLSFAQSLVKERVRDGDAVIDATAGNGVDTLFLARLAGKRGRVYGFDVQREALLATMRRLAAAGVAFAADPADLEAEAASPSAGENISCETNLRPAPGSGSAAQVRLLLRSHAELPAAVPAADHGQIAAVMFNLGYLPGGDPTVITQPSSTLTALDAAMRLLKPGGIITAVLYPGHDGGDAEADAVRDWACRLPRRAAHVISYRPLNHHARAPYLVAVEKR